MFKRLLMTGGTATCAAAALLMTPDVSLAQHHGGGGSHAGGGWGGGGSWQRGANGWRGGYGGYGGYGYGGFGSSGWGYPGYYYGTPQYYVPGVDNATDYATQPDYYSDEAAPAYTDTAPVPNNRIYGSAPRTTEDMNVVRVNVHVPANAEVMFEGEKTIQTGISRRFVSPPLTPGGNYTYDIQARWMENGRPVNRTRHIAVHAGQLVRVDFLRREASDEALEGVGPPHGSISTDQGNLPQTTSPDAAVTPGTLRTPGERDNRRGTINPENAGAAGTTPRTERDNRPGTTNPDGTGAPRTGTTPGDRPGTTPPVTGSNPPPLPPK